MVEDPDRDDESLEDIYRKMGFDPYNWYPEQEAYQQETSRIADRFRMAERDELLRAQAYCSVTDRLYDEDDEIWVFQVLGDAVVPVAYGTQDLDVAEPFIEKEFRDVDSAANHPVMFFTQHTDRELEPADIGEYFFGAGYELGRDVPETITRIGDFEYGLLSDRFLGPGLGHLYNVETFHTDG